MSEKIIGYILLFLSLLTIVLVTVNVYLVFINRWEPISFFNSSSLEETMLASLNSEATGQNSVEIIRVLNVSFHLFLAGFISSSAFKVGRLGVMMVRPIKVDLEKDKLNSKKV